MRIDFQNYRPWLIRQVRVRPELSLRTRRQSQGRTVFTFDLLMNILWGVPATTDILSHCGTSVIF